MVAARLASEVDFDGWRDNARLLLSRAVAPDQVVWSLAHDKDLFDDRDLTEDGRLARDKAGPETAAVPTAPRAFVDVARRVALHSDPSRFARLYNVLWRMRSEPRLFEMALDADVARLHAMDKAVRRDVHKMRAFVRFRSVVVDRVERFVAWFEPEHHILEANAPFFMRRYAGMNWSILTPRISAHWNGDVLTFGAGGTRSEAPPSDDREDLWRAYYANIFNPARLKVQAMRAEMPKKYWKNLPETALVSSLIEQALKRSDAMIAAGGAAPNPRPQKLTAAAQAPAPTGANTLASLRAEVSACRLCPLWEPATQAVPGEGEAGALLMFVGEQPGDQEDLVGRPFVGPAGRLFDRAAAEAGIDRRLAYITNAVKHFKFEPRGKRRLHKTPGGPEIVICNGWLRREIELVRPRMLIALGGTAAHALFGKPVRVGEFRGRIVERRGSPPILVTVHPSYVLRIPDEARRVDEHASFVEDLRAAAEFLRR